MYQVWECYHAQGNPDKTVRRLGDFADFEQAKSFAEASYNQLNQIPESARMSVCIIAPNGQWHTVPLEH